MAEKEWEVYINDKHYGLVYDETKEGAESWVAKEMGVEYAHNEGFVDIVAEDNETEQEDMLPH